MGSGWFAVNVGGSMGLSRFRQPSACNINHPQQHIAGFETFTDRGSSTYGYADCCMGPEEVIVTVEVDDIARCSYRAAS